LTRRRKAVPRGFRKSYSLSRLVIEQLALRWVTRRGFLSRIAVDFYRGSEEEKLSEERKGNALQQVSNILNHLKKKCLIHIVPRRFVVNVPRTLHLYYINLPKRAKGDRYEGLRIEKYNQALRVVARAFQENLGIDFPLSEAQELSKKVITSYYGEFYGYLVALDSFIDKASEMLHRINQPDINEYFNRRVTEIVSRHLLDIIAGRSYEEFIIEILELVRRVTSYKLAEEVAERWRILSSKIHALSHDPDFRTASYARQFLEVSVDADLFMSFPLPLPTDYTIYLRYEDVPDSLG